MARSLGTQRRSPIRLPTERKERLAALTRLHAAWENVWLASRGVSAQWTERNAARGADQARVRRPVLKMIRETTRMFGTPDLLARLGLRLWSKLGAKTPVPLRSKDPNFDRMVAALTRSLLARVSEKAVEEFSRDIVHELAQAAERSEIWVRDSLGLMPLAPWREREGFRKQVSEWTDVEGVFVQEYPELVNEVNGYMTDAVGSQAEQVSRTVVNAANPAKPRAIGEVSREIRQKIPEMSVKRANMISRTETARVYGQTSYQQYKRNGIERRRVLTAAGSPAATLSPVCALCIDLAAQAWAETEDSFESGVAPDLSWFNPPFHPYCRCDTVGDVKGWLPPMEEIEPGKFDDLLKGQIDPASVKKHGVGVNKTFRGTTQAGQKVFIKPKSGMVTERLRSSIPVGQEMGRERASWLANKRLAPTVDRGFVPMPRTVIRDAPNPMRVFRGEAVVSEFVEGSTLAEKRLFWDALPKKAQLDMAVYDSVVGNLDRHVGNAMINEKTGEWFLIDHGLTFPTKFSPGAGELFDVQKLTAAHRRSLTGFLADRKAITSELVPLIGEEATELTFTRVEYMLKESRTLSYFERYGGKVPGGKVPG